MSPHCSTKYLIARFAVVPLIPGPLAHPRLSDLAWIQPSAELGWVGLEKQKKAELSYAAQPLCAALRRFYGTVTAFVPGKASATYKFTSSLAVQVLKGLEPQLVPLQKAEGTQERPAETG